MQIFWDITSGPQTKTCRVAWVHTSLEQAGLIQPPHYIAFNPVPPPRPLIPININITLRDSFN